MSMDVLQTKIRLKKNPAAVALDLRQALIPPEILRQAFEAYGVSPRGLAEAMRVFGEGVLDALQEVVPAVKLQTGYFEALGPDGLTVLGQLCAYAKKLEYYVIVETMRADAEPTATLLAQTYFGATGLDGQSQGLYQADAVSLGGFLGSDGITPYLPYCKEGKSLFVVAKTPNRSSREVQDLLSGDRVIYTVMADLAMRWGAELLGQNGYSELGIVAGAPHPEILRLLREKYDRLFFLVPGYAEQGGSPKEVQNAFDKFGHGAVVAASECLLGAWKKGDGSGLDYAERVRAAAVKMRTDLSVHVTVM